MRFPTYLVRSRHGYSFRIIIPKHLRPLIGRTAYKRFLGHDIRMAQAWAQVLANRYISAFNAWGRDEVADKTLEELLASAQSAKRKDYSVERRADGSTIIKADGPEDHAMAMEALRASSSAHYAPSSAPAIAPPSAQALNALAQDAPVGIKAISAGEVMERYLASIKPETKPKTFSSSKKPAIERFVEYIRPKTPWHTITREHCDAYKQDLLNNFAKGTATYRMNYIKQCFTWSQAFKYYPKGDNPAQGLISMGLKDRQISASKGWQTYTTEQLKIIFDYRTYTVKFLETDADRWIPLILLYTGARSNEIGRLELADFKDEEGIKCMSISLVGQDKSVKTPASMRLVPIHPDLLELGLWRRVERLKIEKEKKLFPELNFKALNGPASNPQKHFLKHLKDQGVEAREGTLIGLHSFRDTVISRMRRMGVEQSWREMYVGHEVTGDKLKVAKQKNSLIADNVIAYSDQDNIDNVIAHAEQTIAYHVSKNCHSALNWSEVFLDLPAFKTLIDEPEPKVESES